MTEGKGQISIWFFIGALLLVYGAIILGSGLYYLSNPLPRSIVRPELHIDIWWGLLMLAGGAIYSFLFFPKRSR